MKKSFLRILSVLLVCVMLIGIMPTASVASEPQTEETESNTANTTVPFSVPAIFADAGDTVTLSDYSVMFSSSAVTPSYRITWSSGTLTVTDGTVTATSKGVYTVTATSGASAKTIYIVVKEKNETEYVLYEKDFSTVDSWDALEEEGYAITENKGVHTFEVVDGRLEIGGNTHQDPLTVSLPMWLADFGDYTIEADMEMTSRQSNTRFWGITYNYQGNTWAANYPNIHLKILDSTAGDNYTLIAVDRRSARWTWHGAVDGTGYSKDIFADGTEHAYKMEIYGTHLDAYVDGNLALDTEYVKNYPTGAIGFFSRGVGYAVSNIKVTLDKEKIEALYDNFVEFSTPAVFADAGETVDLSTYSVTHSSGVVMGEESLTWSSEAITIDSNKVTPAAAGVYKLTATPAIPSTASADMTTTVYLVVKNPEDKEYVLFDIDYADVASVDDLTNQGYVMAEIPDGNTVTIENGALAVKGDGSNNTYGNVNTRIILPEWLSDFSNVSFSSDIKVTQASNTSRYFSLMYRVQNDSSIAKAYYPMYAASYRVNGLTNLSYAAGLNSGNTPDWKTGIDGITVSSLNDSTTHSYTVSVSGNRVRSYMDDTKLVDGDYIGQNSDSAFDKGYLGYFVRDMDVEIYNTKVTVRNERANSAYEEIVPEVNPAILADTGDTVDLTKYAVICDDIALYDNAVWQSDDITITDGKVTPTAAGVYKFTVTEEKLKKNVYLLVKEPEDTEYVLYDIDYSDVSSVDELKEKGFIIAEQPSGFTIDMENGALAIKGASTYKNYTFCRVMLPEWLGDFGNYSMSADVKTLASPNTNRYFALIYRIQNDSSIAKPYYPLYTASFRARGNTHNLSYASDSAPTWGDGVTMASTASLLDDTVHNFNVTVFGNNVKVYADDLAMTDTDYIGVNDNSGFDSGYLGYMVIGADIEIYNTRVVYMPNEAADAASSMVITDKASSNVILPASVITYINSTADLSAIEEYTTAPATAILRVDESMNVVDENGEVITTVTDALTYLGKKVIPAFYVKNEAATDAVVSFVKENGLYDIFAVSDNADLLKRARAGYNMIRGVLDFSGKTLTKDDILSVREATNKSGSRICILPEDLTNRNNVELLQNLEMAVWVESDGTAVDTVSDIVAGTTGIITQDVNGLVTAFTKYFSENTMIRPVLYVGHQGVYTLEQPNTVSGMLRAYELGGYALETDVHLSKDGVIISMHDDTLDRASTGTGLISDYTYEELQQYVVDQHGGTDTQPIATLEDHFKALKGLDVSITVEIKSYDNAICQKLVDLIKEYDMADQVNVSTFNIDQIILLKELMPEMSVGLLDGSVAYNYDYPEQSAYYMLKLAQKYDTIYCSTAKGLTLDVARAMFDRGYSVSPSTTDDKPTLSTHVLNGAQKVCTNYIQYITDTVKSLHTDKTEYVSKTEEIDITVNTKTYGRTLTPVTDANLVFVDGDDVFTYENGKIKASEEGSATLMFTYECKTVNDETYNVVTEPFTVAYASLPETVTGSAGTDSTYSLHIESGVLTVNGTGNVSEVVSEEYVSYVKEIVIPESITGIEKDVFSDLVNVEKVTVNCTKEAWEDMGGNDAGLSDAVVNSIEFVESDYTISAVNTAVTFENVKEGYAVPAAQTVTVENAGNTRISGYTVSNSDKFDIVYTSSKVAKGEQFTFTVTPKANLAVGTHTEEITVTTTEGTTATITVSITVIAATHVLDVDDNTLEFGDVIEGNEVEEQTFTVTNKGNTDASFTVTGNDHFDVQASDDVIAANESVTFTVSPKETLTAGSYIDTITVKTDKAEVTVTANFTLTAATYTIETSETELIFDTVINGNVAGFKTFTVTNTGNTKVTGVTVIGAEKFTASVSATEIAVDGEITVTVTPKEELAVGTHTETLTVSTTEGTADTIVVTIVVEAKDPELDACKIFTDVKHGAWYENFVNYAYENGIMIGTSDTKFEPNTTMSRAMVVNVIARIAGVDTNALKNQSTKFSDVPAGKWYTGAVVWAVNYGVTKGTSTTTFDPEAAVTRQDLCTLLVRYADKAGIEFNYDIAKVAFPDDAEISAYAKSAVYICQQAGIVCGTPEGTFDPRDNATRSAVAKMITIFHQDYIAK